MTVLTISFIKTKKAFNCRGDSVNRPASGDPPGRPYVGRQLETFSRGQQVVVLLLIFGMTLLYFRSIHQPDFNQVGWAAPTNNRWAQPTLPDLQKPATDHRLPTTNNFSGAKLLTLNKQINLNTAMVSDLEAISGIGPKTAEKIIEYRKEHGKFDKIEDVMNVRGIKEKKFEKIKRYLTVK